MPVELLRVGVFAAGVILVVTAALGGRVLAGAGGRPLLRTLRAGLAVGGIVLMAWTALPYLARQAAPRTTPAPTMAASADVSPADLMAQASSQLAACPIATAPTVPDGATATLEQMRAARAAFQSYDAATNTYVRCVDSTVDRLNRQFKGVESDAQKRLQTLGTSAHNTAIDQEQALADRFNTQIRTFKGRHPQS
jgi:hypothetical protein